MKLLTHNMLSSKCLKDVVTGYPLGLEVKEIRIVESDFNKDFISRIIPKLNWSTFWSAAKQKCESLSFHETRVTLGIRSCCPCVDMKCRRSGHEDYEKLGHEGRLTEQLSSDYETDEDFLRDVHHALVEVDIVEGGLICPETRRKFLITDGIPNMLVTEDEL